MKNISDITKILNENSVSFSTMEEVGLNDINITKSLDNQVRPIEAVVEERVEDYAISLQCGDEFPPVLLFQDNDKYIISDGNHRIEAVKAIGWDKYPFGAIICDAPEATMILVGQQINMMNGLPQSREDRMRAAIQLVKTMGVTIKDAAHRFRLIPGSVSEKIRIDEAIVAVRKVLGPKDSNRISGTAAKELGTIKDDDLFSKAVKYASEAKLSSDECRQLSREIRSYRRHAEAVSRIDSIYSSFKKTNAETAGANENVVKSRRLCRQAINALNRIQKMETEFLPEDAKRIIVKSMCEIDNIQTTISKSIKNGKSW